MPVWLQIVVSVIGGAAATTTIFTFYLNRRDKASRLSVGFAFAHFAYGSELSEQHVMFTVANPGERSVWVKNLHIPLPDGRTIAFFEIPGEQRVPYELAPGKCTKHWLPLHNLRAELERSACPRGTKLPVVVTDATGKQYRSAKLNVH